MSAMYHDNSDIVPIASQVAYGDSERAEPAPPQRTYLAPRRLWLALVLWQQKREQRHALRMLTEDQLRDIGLSPAAVAREVAKSFFWDR